MIITKQARASLPAFRVLIGSIAVGSLAACGTHHPKWNPGEEPRNNKTATPVEIRVTFDDERCPTAVNDQPDIKADSGKQVHWLAYTEVDGESVFDPTIVFAVYFDPFVDGRPIASRHGIARSGVINRNTPQKYASGPDVIYKYTVLGQPEDCKPRAFDPHIRILR